MSILGLICVLLALVATLLFVLFMFQRRDLRAVTQLSLSVQRALSGERLPQRIEIDQEQLDLQALGVAINQLLMRAARTAGREKSGPRLFTELGERIHEAVLVHRDVILYANSQFASFVGVDRVVRYVLVVRTRVQERRSASIVIAYEVSLEGTGETAATGTTRLACVDRAGRVRRLPPGV